VLDFLAPGAPQESAEAAAAAVVEEDTRTLVRRRMQRKEEDATDSMLRRFLGDEPGATRPTPSTPGTTPAPAPTSTAPRAPTRAERSAERRGGGVEGGAEATSTLMRRFLDAEEEDDLLLKGESAQQLAPIQAISAEGLVLPETPTTQSEGSKDAGDAGRRKWDAVAGRYSSAVPEHLLPGNNAAQMNWAERQLSQAQQKQRALSDLPGFAASFLKGQAEEAEEKEEAADAEGEVEVTKVWNPIPWKDPESRLQKRKVLKTVAQITKEKKSAAAVPSQAEAPPRNEQEQMDDVLGVLFNDDVQV
jgi:hypothetical protein